MMEKIIRNGKEVTLENITLEDIEELFEFDKNVMLQHRLELGKKYVENKFPENKAKPGRWIGINWQSGDHMTYKVLPEDPDVSENGRIILTRSVIEPENESNL